MKKILFILLFLAFIITLTGCTKGDAKKGFEIVQNEISSYYYASGVKRGNVIFDSCEYVMVKGGSVDKFYYHVKFSVHFGTYANDFVEDYCWYKGNNGSEKVSYATYSEQLEAVNNKTVKGSVGTLKG